MYEFILFCNAIKLPAFCIKGNDVGKIQTIHPSLNTPYTMTTATINLTFGYYI
jgi:hypothetical protein